jgi:DNA-directed RNA polymerase specialized sigma24 family protein
VNRRDEIGALPETYALALRLRAEGLGDDAIARVLEIEAESVGPLLALARAKLAKLEQLPEQLPEQRSEGDGEAASTA